VIIIISTHELRSYAGVLMRGALNLQEGDHLIVFLPVDYKGMSEIIEHYANEMRCGKTDIFYESKIDEFNHYNSGNTVKYDWISEENFSYIENSIESGARLMIFRSEFFGLFEALSPEVRQLRTQYYYQDFFRIYKYVQAAKVQYCLGALPNKYWAKVVFPDLSDDEAISALWDKMLKSIYLDTPVPFETWLKRANVLTKRRNLLNEFGFDEIRFLGEGTDFRVKLPKKGVWQGGLVCGPDGREFIPNIPTEEVYTTPLYDGVSGTLSINKGIFFGGSIVKPYKLFFENGRLTSVESPAEEFAGKLLKYLDEFDGGRYLGEIALVSDDAGVKQQDMFFYDMVYDENSSCHFAFGSSYRNTITGGEKMTAEEFASEGGNNCQMHMDFLIDSESMIISGIKNGESHIILEYGNWVL
jgi:aminopeptidase